MGISGEIEKWMKSRVREAGANGIVVGMSGGLDSSVVAALSSRAAKTLGIMIPCESDSLDTEHAEEVTKKFGIETRVIDIGPVYDGLLKELPEAGKKAKGNLKSRLRTGIVYYFANRGNLLVAGTSNKCELITGYVTKHGDTGADMEPLGGLLKSEVREIAKEIGIPDSIVKKEPSAGLWKGQTDEGELGISYDELERVIRAIENDDTRSVKKGLAERVMEMIEKSGHKREPPPIFRSGE